VTQASCCDVATCGADSPLSDLSRPAIIAHGPRACCAAVWREAAPRAHFCGTITAKLQLPCVRACKTLRHHLRSRCLPHRSPPPSSVSPALRIDAAACAPNLQRPRCLLDVSVVAATAASLHHRALRLSLSSPASPTWPSPPDCHTQHAGSALLCSASVAVALSAPWPGATAAAQPPPVHSSPPPELSLPLLPLRCLPVHRSTPHLRLLSPRVRAQFP
jgi:hypothetical protein